MTTASIQAQPEFVNGVVQDIEKFVTDAEKGGTVNLYFLSPNVAAKTVKAIKPDGTVGAARITPARYIQEHLKELRHVPCAYEWVEAAQ